MTEILPNFHPMLVHFSVAPLSVATAFFVLLALTGERLPEGLREQWAVLARWSLWLGAGASFLTVLAGFHAYSTVAHDGPSHAAMTDHRNWAIGTFVLFVTLAGWSIMSVRAERPHGKAFVALLVAAQLALLSTGWRGGELVYRYGLGVLALPVADSDGHGHGAGSGPDSNDEHTHDDVNEH